MIVVASIVVLALLAYWVYTSSKNSISTTPKPTIPVVTHSTDTPDEKRLGADYKWQGNPGDPKKLKIASVNVDAYIQRVGVDQNKQVAVPDNIHLAGWFVDSVQPGQKGLSIVDGHVDGRTVSEGVFSKLGQLVEGDELTVETGSGKVLTYRVVKTATIPKEQAAGVLYEQIPSVTSQLNLITCTGTYQHSEKTYDQRTIVSAELIQ